MELKLKNQKLLYCHSSTFNRTNMELKLPLHSTYYNRFLTTFNRTNMELKQKQAYQRSISFLTFNRTNMELKQKTRSNFMP